MLDAMRRGAVNWLAKVLLGLLIIAFAMWGVADVFRGYGRGTLARIGNTEISTEEYRQAYQDEMASLSRRLGGRRLTAEQAKMLGVEQRTLSRLIGWAAIDTHAHDLKLALSDQTIAEMIRTDPAFQDVTGKFSTSTFRNLLRQNGISEARYLNSRRKEEVREQLTDTLIAGVSPPQYLVDLLHRYRDETRIIEFFTPDYDKLVKVADPDEAKLKEFYEQNKRQFMTPELRKANVLLLTRADLKARRPVTDEETKAAYEQEKEKFNIPEKRHVLQISFPDKAAAEKAYAELANAPNFVEAATKLGFKEADFDLGQLAKKDMIDPKIAEAAFALPKDELSKPVEGRFSTVLLRVTEIVPGKQRPYEEVKQEIADRLSDERASAEIQKLHDQVEDERSTGKPLKEIADSLKLPFRELPDMDRTGKTADGKPALDSPDAAKIAQAAFSASIGIDADAADLSDGGYAWIEVLGSTPEKQKSFEEVKDEVKTAALEAERRKEVTLAASKLVERLAKGESIEAVAAETGGKVEKTPAVTRNTSPPGLPQNAVQLAFTLPKGGATSAPAAGGKARIILRVAEVTPAPAATAEQTDRIRGEVAQQMQQDVLAEYISGLEARYGLSVNDAALKQALGGRDQSDSE
ncbi:MAG TPA: SurA N-terminal domain-containing protein [Hyphomicrobiaceae bacterium]|nr:SurA N-terminal domain-containing protein [Hyphomicrobiaceae bacterium]